MHVKRIFLAADLFLGPIEVCWLGYYRKTWHSGTKADNSLYILPAISWLKRKTRQIGDKTAWTKAFLGNQSPMLIYTIYIRKKDFHDPWRRCLHVHHIRRILGFYNQRWPINFAEKWSRLSQIRFLYLLFCMYSLLHVFPIFHLGNF